jgi:hypothetical protein
MSVWANAGLTGRASIIAATANNKIMRLISATSLFPFRIIPSGSG